MSEIRDLKDDIIKYLVNNDLYNAEESMKELIQKLWLLKNCENCSVPDKHKQSIEKCQDGIYWAKTNRFCNLHHFKSIEELY